MHVAVLGAGYAGLTAVRRLERRLPDDAGLTLVNDEPYHLVQHELHRAIRRPDIADTIRVPLDDVLDRAEFVEARVESVDRAAGTATLDTGEELDYDYAAVCLGAETAFYDLPGVEANAIPLKRLADAERVRERFLDADGGRFVVGGAGLSGIQVAGELAALADEEGVDAEVVLLEMADSVAPGFAPDFQEAVRAELDDRGIDVRTGTAVAGADASTVELESGEELDYDGFVWAGGIRGPAALGGERPETRANLRAENGTFLVGDAARVVDDEGAPVPASAQAALREAKVAADNIAALVAHDREGTGGFEPRLDRYTFDTPGWVVTVGDGAVAKVGPTVLRGQAARAAKATIGAAHLSSVGAITNASRLVREEL
ncbi:NAD(P)/FAD-dependent oxidoreductase [Halosegnis marinus]|uniref:NAD(P)/FAD-dependent oxidoreductase n=1 Tax=Halosegnis marinus TaxID=3034023 RepID=A0ABD5ZRL3_9EURY|nr:FAD-dependent oxidoreductase [Halosegnis sp. DT85]